MLLFVGNDVTDESENTEKLLKLPPSTACLSGKLSGVHAGLFVHFSICRRSLMCRTGRDIRVILCRVQWTQIRHWSNEACVLVTIEEDIIYENYTIYECMIYDLSRACKESTRILYLCVEVQNNHIQQQFSSIHTKNKKHTFKSTNNYSMHIKKEKWLWLFRRT